MALNWDWKDMEACIFPWGLVHQHGIWATARDTGQGARDRGQTRVWKVEAALKTAGKAMVAAAKLLERCDEILPADEGSWVAFVVPDEHLLGAEGEFGFSGTGPRGRISAAIHQAIEAMLRLKVHFRIVREWELLTKGSEFNYEIAVFPVPFVWRDDTFEAVKRFVEEGGIAVITGDFTFDPDRRRTRTHRLKTLTGFDFVSGISSPFDLDATPTVRCVATDDEFGLTEWQGKPCVIMGRGTRDGGRVLAMTEKGEPLVVARKVGKGLAVFCADAPEFRSVEETMRLYKALLKRATELKGIEPEWRVTWILGRRLKFGVEPDLLMFGAAVGYLGWVFVAANPTDKTKHAHFYIAEDRMRISVPSKSVGVLLTGTHGEAESALFVGDFWGVGSYGQTLLLSKAEGLAMELQGRVIPLQPGEIQIRCTTPKVKVTVCDLLTGKALLSYQAEAKDGWLKFKVVPELVLTQWRIANGK